VRLRRLKSGCRFSDRVIALEQGKECGNSSKGSGLLDKRAESLAGVRPVDSLGRRSVTDPVSCVDTGYFEAARLSLVASRREEAQSSMLPVCFARGFRSARRDLVHIALSFLVVAMALRGGGELVAQEPPSPASADGLQQERPPAAGGPKSDVGPYAIPRKKDEPPTPAPPERPKKIEGLPDYSIRVDVPLVEVPVTVTTKGGQFISTLQRENFRVYEDGVPQTISNFTVAQAPITAVLLTEFASTNYAFVEDALRASYSFANTLRQDDWVAVVSYDIRPQTLVDFTRDKGAVYGALNQLRVPGFAETNLFDALYDTLDRIDRIEGHKYVVLVSTGFDSFSKINLDQITRKIKSTHDLTIFAISVGWIARQRYETAGRTAPHGLGIPISRIDYLQADNQMQTFARLTGGRFYQPRFEAEYPEVFHDISGDIRNQYEISFHSTNSKLDGSYRKLKVDVIAPDGGPLRVRDQKGKDVRYQVIAREGYTAKHTVE
jgi:VWFA-related protein